MATKSPPDPSLQGQQRLQDSHAEVAALKGASYPRFRSRDPYVVRTVAHEDAVLRQCVVQLEAQRERVEQLLLGAPSELLIDPNDRLLQYEQQKSLKEFTAGIHI